MKRLLAMLMSLFISMFENVDYQFHADTPFEHNAYFTVDVREEDIDYRDLYGKQIAAGSNYSCVPSTYSAASSVVNYNDGATRVGAEWIVANSSKDYSEITGDSFLFETDAKIVCPYAGTLITSSKTSNGRSMEIAINVGGNNYRMVVEEMERWWCCDGKISYDDPEAQEWDHTCSELKGTTFKAGTCLGRATAGETKVTIYQNNDVVPLSEFFNN